MVTLKTFTTLATSWFLSFLMHSYVFVQIGFLRKRLVAKRFGTQKWTFSRVYSEVIEKIMPFPKKHLAVDKVTFQQFNMSLSSRVFVFKNSKFSRWRNLLLNFDWAEVKTSPVLDLYFSTRRNFVSDCCFLNLITSYSNIVSIKRI